MEYQTIPTLQQIFDARQFVRGDQNAKNVCSFEQCTITIRKSSLAYILYDFFIMNPLETDDLFTELYGIALIEDSCVSSKRELYSKELSSYSKDQEKWRRSLFEEIILVITERMQTWLPLIARDPLKITDLTMTIEWIDRSSKTTTISHPYSIGRIMEWNSLFPVYNEKLRKAREDDCAKLISDIGAAIYSCK